MFSKTPLEALPFYPPHNSKTKFWYDDINAAYVHCIAHQKQMGFYWHFQVEEYND